jgi:hypothetical protein
LNKNRLTTIFLELIEDYRVAEDTVISDRGSKDDYEWLDLRLDNYKKDFLKALQQ